MNFIQTYRSANFNDRPNAEITHIILHYTDLESAKISFDDRLCNLQAKVSAHYLIDYNGDIYQLVDDDKRAWHAGVSTWQGRDNVNDYSIGIELQNRGRSITPPEPYPLIQLEALVTLLKYLMHKHHIPLKNIIGHSDIAPGRRFDPGEHFDWVWLKSKLS